MPVADGFEIIDVDDTRMNDEAFKQSLRSQGIYFDVNVNPSSPKKQYSPKIRKAKSFKAYDEKANLDRLNKLELNIKPLQSSALISYEHSEIKE